MEFLCDIYDETFLCYVWQHKLLKGDLCTTRGQQINIIRTGIRNNESGADFLQAEIEIDGIRWMGNVEIHVKSSNWQEHKHHVNPAFENVILHVVLQHDKIISYQNGEPIPTLELKEYLSPALCDKYQRLMKFSGPVPCEGIIRPFGYKKRMWLERLTIERLETKSERIFNILKQTKGAWEEVLYRLMARCFGGKTNGEPFEQLAERTPLAIVSKIKNEKNRIEALYFGQAGFLAGEFQDDYPNTLSEEYAYMQKIYRLQPLKPTVWNFMKQRPYGFPTMRISQWSDMLYKSHKLFSYLLTAPNLKELTETLSCSASSYWETHFRFDIPTAPKTVSVGKDFVRNLLINAIIPLMFIYGRERNQTSLCDYALQMLDMLPPEKNQIINHWNKMGVRAASAFESQALIQLKNERCNALRCLECMWGHEYLKNPEK